eukprot:273647_1
MGMYIFWFVRIYQIFKSSIFWSLSKCQFSTIVVIFAFPSVLVSFVMSFGAYKAFMFVTDSNNDWSMINTFDDCRSLTHLYQTETIQIVQFSSLTLYSLTEIVYAIVIIRLFVSNIMKLSVFCREGLPWEKNKNKNDASKSKPEQSYFLEVSIKTANLMIFSI